MTTDPIGQSGGLNIYSYTGGDPINFSDPLGLSDVPNCDDVPDQNNCRELGTTGTARRSAIGLVGDALWWYLNDHTAVNRARCEERTSSESGVLRDNARTFTHHYEGCPDTITITVTWPKSHALSWIYSGGLQVSFGVAPAAGPGASGNPFVSATVSTQPATMPLIPSSTTTDTNGNTFYSSSRTFTNNDGIYSKSIGKENIRISNISPRDNAGGSGNVSNQ